VSFRERKGKKQSQGRKARQIGVIPERLEHQSVEKVVEESVMQLTGKKEHGKADHISG